MHYYSRLVFLSLVLACSHGQNSLDTVDLADTSNLPDIVNRAIKTCGSIRNLIDGRCPPNPNQPTVTPGMKENLDSPDRTFHYFRASKCLGRRF